MSTPFSAGPQAIGYLHQARYALLALLRENREEAAVVIEGLDDIEIQDITGTVQLDQLKHHLKGRATLTNTSPELWKTIRIWASQLRSGGWNSGVVRLHLVTTATASEGSVAWYLKAGNTRDEAKAKNLLTVTADKSETKDESLRKSFSEFNKLSERDQLRLLRAITVIDSAANISETSTLIKRQIKWAAPPTEKLLDNLYEQLEGWWFAKVVEQLTSNSAEPISQPTVHRKIWSITEQLREDNLPIDYAKAVPDYAINPDSDDRIFVQQLRILEIRTERIKKAILDYYRAFEQRASWVRNQLLIDDELERYEQKLIDEWEVLKFGLEDELLSDEMQENECLKLGRRLLKWVETEARMKIRPDVEDRFIIRGSYHILADTEKPRVVWHPRFLDRLEELLTR